MPRLPLFITGTKIVAGQRSRTDGLRYTVTLVGRSCAASDPGFIFVSLINRLIILLLNLLCLTGICLWALLPSFRTGQVAQAKAGLLGNGVLDCAFEHMAAQEGNGKRR